MIAKIIGLLILGVPALMIGAALLWRRYRPVFFFFLALLAVGLGYLATTGAAEDVYYAVFGAPIAQMQPTTNQ